MTIDRSTFETFKTQCMIIIERYKNYIWCFKRIYSNLNMEMLNASENNICQAGNMCNNIQRWNLLRMYTVDKYTALKSLENVHCW